MKIFLIGFMGSGKSTIGLELASQLGYSFIDLDELIEEKKERTIKEIFVFEGEDKFRKFENKLLKDLKNKDNIVFSIGGTTPCYLNNMDVMNSIGETIYFQVDKEELLKRWLDLKTKRPLLWGKTMEDISDYIEQSLKERESDYKKAKHVLNEKNITIANIKKLVKL